MAGEDFISEVVLGRNSGRLIINFSSPVRDQAGQIRGLVLGSIRTATLTELFQGSWEGKTGQINLLNRQGLLLTEPRHSQELKARGETVPVSAYDAFAALVRVGCLPADSLPAWNAVIGLRNRIVHDYMNVDMVKIFEFLRAHGDRPVLDFLRAPLADKPNAP